MLVMSSGKCDAIVGSNYGSYASQAIEEETKKVVEERQEKEVEIVACKHEQRKLTEQIEKKEQVLERLKKDMERIERTRASLHEKQDVLQVCMPLCTSSCCLAAVYVEVNEFLMILSTSAAWH
jgi:uncharacterized protein (DUF3084 family)